MLGHPQPNGDIEIEFQTDQWGTNYSLFRMEKGMENWGAAIQTFSGVDSSGWIRHLDTATEKGKSYEYRVIKNGVQNFVGVGYLMTGIEIAPVHDRGVLLLLVNEDLLTDASTEIDKHVMDIAADGWNVEYVVVPNTKNTVHGVRQLIDDQLAFYSQIEAIYLLGDIAVPYSGQFCNNRNYSVPPDGHGPGQGDHCGAWAADVYYAIHNATWYDEDSITQYAKRSENQNIPGDGKFDEIRLPGKVESQLGRVDLSDLSNFTESESELVKRYIQKNHDYRYGIEEVHDLALIDENFSARTGAFASTAWRNFPSLIGKGKTEEKDFLTTLKDSIYILAYGAGAGSYRSCANVATSADMVDNNAAIFNFLFGSFFGDWDISNNFLRTILATPRGGLTNAWSGRPWWQLHPMGMGESIGYCTRISQNSSDLYEGAIFENSIHIALMGDPTLRMYNFPGATDLSITANSSKDEVELNWTASTEKVNGYYVYYSWSPSGPFVLATLDAIKETSYTHTAPFDGDVYYTVRAERLEETPSGSFFNLSQGVVEKVEGLDALGVDAPERAVNVNIFPNPARDVLVVTTEGMTKGRDWSICDLSGRAIIDGRLNSSPNWSRTEIDLSHLSEGVYLIRFNNSLKRFAVVR